MEAGQKGFSKRGKPQMLISFAPIGSLVAGRQITENDARSKLLNQVNSKQQVRECEIKRYGAYFKGWCQVFGEHESILVGEHENCWLIGENKVGLVLPKALLKQLNGEVLLHEQIPEITFSQQGVQIGSLHFPFKSELEKSVLGAIEQLIDFDTGLHLFLSSHLLYGNGRRIITVSNKRPQSIIYKEIGVIKLRMQ
jgi:hypothetical protein